MRQTRYVTLVLLLGSVFCGALPASAAGLSAQITGKYPTGAVRPGETASFSVSISGFTNPTFALDDSFSGTSLQRGNIDASGAVSWTPKNSDGGVHNIKITVTDASGTPVEVTTTVVVLASELVLNDLAPGSTIFTNTPVSFTTTAPGFSSPIYFFVSDSYAGSSVSYEHISTTGTFKWTPRSNEQGEHAITVLALDANNRRLTGTQKLMVVAPSLSLVASSTGTFVAPGTAIQFTASTTGFASSTLSLSDSFFPSTAVRTATETAGVYSWTPTESDLGVHMLTVRAKDSIGNNASASITLTVTKTPAPVSAQTTPATTPPPVATTASTTTPYVFSRFLTIGSQGEDVTALQKRLTAEGVYAGPITGYFGALTNAAVKRFQAAHGISQLGIVGPQTRAALNR